MQAPGNRTAPQLGSAVASIKRGGARGMEDFAAAAVFAILLGFVGFRQWLRHQQRAWVHRERLAALEKGVELPPWPVTPREGLGMSLPLLSA